MGISLHLTASILLVGMLVTTATCASSKGKTYTDCVPGLTSGSLQEVREKADVYIKRAIANIPHYLRENYEPLEVEKIGDLQTIKVRGLSSAQLIGSPKVIQDSRALKYQFKMSFTNLISEANVNRNFKGFEITGKIKVSIESMELYVTLSFNSMVSYKPELDQIMVTKWGEVQAKIVDGNWASKMASSLAPSILTDEIKKNVPEIIEHVINMIISDLNVACQAA